jgi:PAS domain-containing protein
MAGSPIAARGDGTEHRSDSRRRSPGLLLRFAGAAIADDIMLAAPPELARVALQSAPDAMIIVNALGTIVFVNAQMGALFGCVRGELVGQFIEAPAPDGIYPAPAVVALPY